MKTVVLNGKKICSKCGKEKDIVLFRKYLEKRNGKFYYRSECIECEKIYNAEYGKQWAIDNKDELKEYRKQWRSENQEYISQYEIKNKKTILDNRNKRYATKIKNDPVYKLRTRVSSKIHKALHRSGSSKRGQSIMDFLPYTMMELKNHIEQQFEPWMNWDNHGNHDKKNYNEIDSSTWKWNIDHITPQSSLPYASMADDNFQKCWALENLRPLKSIDNIKKGNKLTS
jgi:hypothetical protein